MTNYVFFLRIKFEIWMCIMATLTGFTNGVSQQVLSKELHDYLFAGYDTNLFPICERGANVTVRVDMALRQILHVNEPKQTLTSSVWMRMKWNDCRLAWDPASFNNVSDMTVLYNHVWFPDITLLESASHEVIFPEREVYSAYITRTGAVYYNFPSILTSVCRVNVRYFPFDTQRCSMKFASWSYHGYQLDIIYNRPFGDSDTYISSNEWELVAIPAERNLLFYNCCPEPYPDVSYYVIVRRRPSFYVLTMLFPCILVTTVSVLTFILPIESGEKISLEITVLLSLSVFLLVVSELLPPASDNFPIIGLYFAASMVLVTISLLMTVLTLNVFHRGANGRKAPRWFKALCFHYIGRIVCVKPKAIGDQERNKCDKQDRRRDRSSKDTYVDLRLSSSRKLKYHPSDESNDTAPYGKEHFKHSGRRIWCLPRLSNASLEDPIVKLPREQNRKPNYASDSNKESSSSAEDNESEWRDIANILDRLFLIIYCAMSFILPLTFMVENIDS